MNAVQVPHPTQDKLAAFGLGKLGPEESAAVEGHVARCDSCCEFLKEVAEDTLVALLRESETESEFGAADAKADAGAATLDAAFPSGRSGGTQVDPLEVELDVPEELANHPRYQVEKLLGKGGMGDVYQARHRLMERTVAIKVINPKIVDRPEAVRRFQREVKAAASLSHPNIVTAYDAEQAGDLHVLVMEYVNGRDLACVVKETGPLSVEEACQCVHQAALELQHAHQCGMVHRDIKPQNLMATPEGEVKILDFGLAQLAREAVAPGRPGGGAAELTDARSMMGTPDYMAPEQAQSAHAADIRSDIYGLGATLYYLLAAAPPFPEGSVVDKLKAHAETEAPPLGEVRDDVPAELEEILRRMMAKDPAEVAEALAPLAGVGLRRRRPLAWVAAAGLAAALVLALSVILTFRTSYGTVTIEIAEADAEDVEVVFKQGEEVHIASAKQGWQIRVKEGKLQLELNDATGKFQLDTDTVTVIRGGRETVRVTLKPKPFERTGKPLLARLRGHEGHVGYLLYCANNNTLVSKSSSTIKLWDAETGELLATLRGNALAVSPDGSTLAFFRLEERREILLWDVATRALKGTLKESEPGVHKLLFSPDGSSLVVRRRDHVINVWDLKTGALITGFQSRCRTGDRWALSPDGTMLAFGGENGLLMLCDVQSGRELWSRKGDPRAVCSVAFSPDGKTLATGNADHYVRLWDVAAGRVLAQLPYYHTEWVCAVAFSPDGKILASGVRDIRLWDVESRRVLTTLKAHSDEIRVLVFYPDGRTLASASLDNLIKVWDIQPWMGTFVWTPRATLKWRSRPTARPWPPGVMT